MLHIIHEKGHTKFPVYANQTFMGLLTQKGITNWLAENNGEGSFSFNDILLKDVLPFEEKIMCYLFQLQPPSMQQLNSTRNMHQRENGLKLC